MTTGYIGCLIRFVETSSQSELDTLIRVDRQDRRDKTEGRQTRVKSAVEKFDFGAKDLTENLRDKDPHGTQRRAFLYRVATALFYEQSGYGKDAIFAYDRAALFAQRCSAETKADEEKTFWTQRKLCLRIASAHLSEKFGSLENTGYNYLYAAEAAEDLGERSLAEKLGQHGVMQFLQAKTKPHPSSLRSLFDQYEKSIEIKPIPAPSPRYD